MARMRAVCLGVQATLAVSSAITSLIVICVAGAALSQVTIHIDIPTLAPPPEPGIPNPPPAMGKPAIIFALVAAFPSLFMSFAIAVVRVLQIRLTGITFSNNAAVALLFSYFIMFLGSILIAAFAAAGVLCAIAATPSVQGQGVKAKNYLIGTSVSSFMAFLVMVCFLLYEMFAGLWTDTKKGDYTEIQ